MFETSMKNGLALLTLLSASLVVGCTTSSSNDGTGGSGDPDPNDLDLLLQVLETNADLAFASYSDSIDTLEDLKTAITALRNAPTAEKEAALAAARTAWLQTNEPYGYTEVYRFRGTPIDSGDDIELQINAWPLGESLIDYVQPGTDPDSDFTCDDVSGGELCTTEDSTGVTDPTADTGENSSIISSAVSIDEALLSMSTMALDERDVISGYHAIEFLLWGQDLNDRVTDPANTPRDPSPGQRPASDFDTDAANCTNGTGVLAGSGDPCTRRLDYLDVAVDKLIADLDSVRDEWEDDQDGNFRDNFTNPADLDEAKDRLCEILTGMGTMAEGELAGERMQIALTADSQEDEHSCFSDNTHRDIVTNADGIFGLYKGDYPGYANLEGTIPEGNTGRAVEGYGIDEYLAAVGLETLANDTTAAFESTEMAYTALDAQVRAGTPFDNLIVDAFDEDGDCVTRAQNVCDTISRLNAESVFIVDIASALQLDCEPIDPDASECDTSNPTIECPPADA